MPILLLLAGITGLAALLSTRTSGSGGGTGPVPLPPKPLPVQAVRDRHVYAFVFRTDRVILDPTWLLLAAPFLPPGAAPISIPDAAHLVLVHVLQSIGFADVVVSQDQMTGRGPDPTVWRGMARWAGQDGEPVEHLVPATHGTLAAIVWIDMQDGGIPLPLPAMSVQGAPMMHAGPHHAPMGHGHHLGGPWYPRRVAAWGWDEPACGPGWVLAPDGSCVFVGY